MTSSSSSHSIYGFNHSRSNSPHYATPYPSQNTGSGAQHSSPLLPSAPIGHASSGSSSSRRMDRLQQLTYFSQGQEGVEDQHQDADEEEMEEEDFVIALHDYAPTQAASTSSNNGEDATFQQEQSQRQVYLAFAAGDRIRVWTRHASGWWDGELAEEGGMGGGTSRGWFPSNFVQEWKKWEELQTDVDDDRRGQHRRPSEVSISSSVHSATSVSSVETGYYRPTDQVKGHANRFFADQSFQSHSIGTSSSSSNSSTSYKLTGGAVRSQSYSVTNRAETQRFPTGGSADLTRASSSLVSPTDAVLEPIVQAISLVRSAVVSRRYGHYQPSTACVISAIRSLLSATECLARESPLLGQIPSLAKIRKTILADLADLVALAKSASAVEPGNPRDEEMQGMLKASQETLNDVRTFLLTLVQHGVDLPERKDVQYPLARPEMAASHHDRGVESSRSVLVKRERQASSAFPLAKSLDNLRLATKANVPTIEVARRRHHQASISSVSSVDSVSSGQDSGDSQSITPSGMPLGIDGKLDMITAIGQTEESLFSVIAALIGHIHSHSSGSHPSSHALLIDLTKETIDRARDLLTIVEAIVKHPEINQVWPREISLLQVSKANMYDITSKLVECSEMVASAPYATKPSDSEDNNKAEILSSATGTLRTASECARLARICSRKSGTGTFDIEVDGGYPSIVGTPSTLKVSQPPAHGNLRLREKSVGQRGEHTLSSLGRKAEDLTSLQKKYRQDGLLAPAPIHDSGTGSTIWRTQPQEAEDDEEELMTKSDNEEDMTMQPNRRNRPRLPSFKTSPVVPGRVPLISTPAPDRRRHRSSSLTSPSNTPRMVPRRSPSKSADLNVLEGDLNFTKTPQNASRKEYEDSQQDTPRPLLLGTTEQPDVRFWLVSHDYNPKDIAFGSDGAMIGATLDVLVEKLTPHDTLVDPNFLETIFLTFRMFTTPSNLLQTLEFRFDLSPPVRMPLSKDTIQLWNERKLMPIRLRILKFLKLWLDSHWQASTDDVVLESMLQFIDERVSKTLPNESSRLRDAIQRHKAGQSAAHTPSAKLLRHSRKLSTSLNQNGQTSPFAPAGNTLPPTPIMNKTLFNALRTGSRQISTTDFHALELARQLTLMESKRICQISSEDLLKTGKAKIASLTAMSTLSNQITGWVADSILDEKDPKKRAALLKFFIKLADRCLGLNNFSTLFAVLAGLNSSTILRLKKTWDVLSPKYRNLMESLRVMIEHSRNHRNYRNRLRNVEGPALPFLGLILTDITFTSDGNQNTRPSSLDPDVKLVNYDKFVKLGRIAVDFQRYQMVRPRAFLHSRALITDRICFLCSRITLPFCQTSSPGWIEFLQRRAVDRSMLCTGRVVSCRSPFEKS